MDFCQKLQVLEQAVKYSNNGCLDCVNNHMGGDRGPSEDEVNGIIHGLMQVGLSTRQVDDLLQTRFSEKHVGKCVAPAKFLSACETLLKEQETTSS